MARIRRHPILAVALGLLVLGPALATVVQAAIPSGDGTIHACYKSYTGEIRIVDKAVVSSCGAGERALSWSSAKLLTGTVQPTGSVGDEGDLYIDLNNKVIWGPKTSSSWGMGANLQGAPGISGLETVEADPAFVAPGTKTDATATCPSGKKVVGGGVGIPLTNGGLDGDPTLVVLASGPVGGDRWFASMQNNHATFNFPMRVRALCANG